MDIRGKKLLILGGNRISCEIIKAAKKLGVYVVVTDYLENSPGKKIADESYMISTTDVEGVVNLIKCEQIDGILTGFIDSMLLYYNEISKKAGIPCYGTYEQFQIATDKQKFKRYCRRFDIPVVDEYHIEFPFIRKDLERIEYPVLIKPVDNSGARGIFICNNADELMEKYPVSISFSKTKQVIIERYMISEEVTIFYLIQNGDIVLSSMADRHVKNSQGGTIPLPVAYTFPSKWLIKYQNDTNNKVVEMFKSMGLKNGMVFIQSFIEDSKCIFYEMGFRLTGSLEFKIIEKLNGLNPMEMMINHALTGKMCDQDIKSIINPNYSKFGFNITFLARPGQIDKIDGIEDVKVLDNVIDVVMAYDKGETILDDAQGTLKQVIIRVLGVADTNSEMIDLMDRVHGLIHVYSEDGEDMLLDVLDTTSLRNG
ncbi:MAG: ATP-grasp domain-containing protein [Eubacteriales bacterium]|nr:ATP-grasp domain-containing protein [Eubacteriales bacterium]